MTNKWLEAKRLLESELLREAKTSAEQRIKDRMVTASSPEEWRVLQGRYNGLGELFQQLQIIYDDALMEDKLKEKVKHE